MHADHVDYGKGINKENVSFQTSLKRNHSNYANIFLFDTSFENLMIACFYYILYSYKISRRSKITSYVINQMLKLQVFVI